ncbi:MAG: hypothetical protein ABH879_05260 [archaeon]
MDKFKDVLKDNLLALIRFGTEGQPNNLLLVLEKLDIKTLDRIRPLVIEHRRKTKVVPLFFTRRELSRAADVFPLEFLDIKHPHELLHGTDYIEKISFQKPHVRRQLEYELRSKLIHLRENYVWAKNMKDLFRSAVPSLMPLFYGLLYIRGAEVPSGLDALFASVEKEYGINLGALRKIREGSDNFEGLMKVLNELILIVDKEE